MCKYLAHWVSEVYDNNKHEIDRENGDRRLEPELSSSDHRGVRLERPDNISQQGAFRVDGIGKQVACPEHFGVWIEPDISRKRCEKSRQQGKQEQHTNQDQHSRTWVGGWLATDALDSDDSGDEAREP